MVAINLSLKGLINIVTKRMNIWLDQNQIKSVELMVQAEDMKNNSAFIGRAIEFYLGYLNTRNSTKYISDILLGEMEGMIKGCEQRLLRLLVSSVVNSESLIQMYAYEADWSAEQVNYLKTEAGKAIQSEVINCQKSS